MSIPNSSRYVRYWHIVGDKKKNAPGMISISTATLWRWSREGKFPKPYSLAPGVTAWRLDEVLDWLDSRTKTIN